MDTSILGMGLQGCVDPRCESPGGHVRSHRYGALSERNVLPSERERSQATIRGWPRDSGICSSKKESDLGDRMESAFNLSFWEKEGAFDWSWLGLDLVNERMTEELLVSLEWSCYRESEIQLIQTFLDTSWPCAAAALRLLQMCHLCDNGILQLPSICPWCASSVTVHGYSLYLQIVNYISHLKDCGSVWACIPRWLTR